MTTTSNIPGNKIKQLISGDSKDYFQWLSKPEDRQQKERLNYLVNLIETYRQTAFIDRYSNGGYENFNEKVFELFRQTMWEENVYMYKSSAQGLLRLLATPGVADAIKKEKMNTDDIVDMVDNLLDFFIAVDTPPYRTMLLSQEVQDFGTDFTDKRIQELIEEYEVRVQVAASGKVNDLY